jgi:hypothetical protein
MNIECGERFVTDEVETNRPMPRTTAEANKLAMVKEFETDSTVKALRKQIAELEAALARATEPAPQPVAKKPQAAPVAPVQSDKSVAIRAALRKPVSESRPAAFFSRESLVADTMPREIEKPAPSPSWLPKLPPAAFGRMR